MKFLYQLFKYIITFFVVLLSIGLVCIALFFSAFYFFEPNQSKSYIEAMFRDTTGQKLNLVGSVEIELIPQAKFTFNDALVEIKVNERRIPIAIKKLTFQMNWHSIFSGRVNINAFKAQNVIVEKSVIKEISGDLTSRISHLSTNFTAKWERGDLSGNIKIDLMQKQPLITGKLKSTQWIFSSISPNSFDGFNIKMDYHIDNLMIQNVKISNAEFNINKENQKLDIQSKGNLANGELNGQFGIEMGSKLIIKSKLNINKADAGEFLKQFHAQVPAQGGTLNIKLQGRSQGNTLRENLLTFKGDSLFSIEKMKILDYQIDSDHVDLFAVIFKSMSSTAKDTLLECGAMRVVINEGKAVAKESIGLETTDLYALGTGNLNLDSQGLELSFDLFPRSIEIGSFDHVIHVKGSISNAIIEKSATGLIKEGGSLILGVGTGGLSLLAEKVVKIVKHKNSPCREVLSMPQ